MNTLIIAEKPELGRAIAEALAGETQEKNGVIVKGNYTIVWAYGHLMRLKEPFEYDEKYSKWNLDDLPIYFKNWELVPSDDKKMRLNQIGSLMEQSDEIIHAGDPDDEGQFLIDEILEHFHYKKPVKRIMINDNTPASIRENFKTIELNDDKRIAVGKAAYARAVADLTVGVNYSRLYSMRLRQSGLAVGRVQSPTLGLVVNRDAVIDGHKKTMYYELNGFYSVNESELKLKFKPTTEMLNGEKYILDQSILENIKKDLKYFPQLKVSSEKTEKKPPLPFNLAKLQGYMNEKHGFDLGKTLTITQELRDKHKAITYNRSDSQYLKEDQFLRAPEVIESVLKKLNKDYPCEFAKKSDCFNDKYVTAHHAIIPTISDFDLNKLSSDERKVYEAICEFYIIQFLPVMKIQKREYIIELDQGMMKASSSKVLDSGYKKYFSMEEEKEENDEEVECEIADGYYDSDLIDSKIIGKETTPPKRYTLKTLNEDMCNIAKYVTDPEVKKILKEKDKDKKGENGSIGTPATRSSIIDNLFSRGYLEKKGKSIISTDLGKQFFSILPDEVKNPDLTAHWWVIQEDIKAAKKQPEALLESVLEAFKPHLTEEISQLNIASDKPERAEVGKCPKCGQSVYENEKSYFCSNYKAGCDFTFWKSNAFFDKFIKIPFSRNIAKELLSKGEADVKLMSKENKEYWITIKYQFDGKYVRFEKEFKKMKKGEK